MKINIAEILKDFDIIDRGDVEGLLDVDGVITKELEQRYSK